MFYRSKDSNKIQNCPVKSTAHCLPTLFHHKKNKQKQNFFQQEKYSLVSLLPAQCCCFRFVATCNMNVFPSFSVQLKPQDSSCSISSAPSLEGQCVFAAMGANRNKPVLAITKSITHDRSQSFFAFQRRVSG